MKPPRLRPGDTIGIVSPGRWLEEEALDNTAGQLEEAGYRVKVGSACRLRDNQYAGTTEDRVKELEEMFADDDVRAIICARGGYGSIRVSDGIDYNLVGRYPKIFVGYSDITALHVAIGKNTGLTTFHGPMLHSFMNIVDPFSWQHLFGTLSGQLAEPIQFPNDLKPRPLRGGEAVGKLIGGNLTLLANMIGTDWDFDTGDKILFVEDVDEKLYRLDRMLLHLKRAGKLDDIAALIVGEMTSIGDEKVPFGKTVDEIVMDVCGDMYYPIVSDFPCGHGRHQMTMPLGLVTKMVCKTKSVEFSLEESPVE